MTACLYQARAFDFGENWTDAATEGAPDALALDSAKGYEREASFEYGKEWTREPGGPLRGLLEQSPVGNARKCQFCAHRLDQGMLPMCVTTCIERATFFGDLNDPTSLVSELASRTNATRLKEELGTQPKVFYLA
ncbi:MAG: 4Fe-4S dicluster domain-containing protein [Trueperaceae bacterium]|nr:4Fe-4S dicluster domain-containing protein [Trueperaceae bacterium]